MSSKSTRVLISGPVNGSLSSFFSKVENINSKSGPFHFLIGIQLFPSKDLRKNLDEFLSTGQKVPLPMYFIDDGNDTLKDIKLPENLIIFDNEGIKEIEGIRILYLNEKFSSEKIINSLESEENKRVDIMVSTLWPEGILNLVSGNSRPTKPITTTSVDISKVAAVAMPRYLFSANINSPVYFERIPYFNLSSKLITRFCGLAPFFNNEKQKFMYALNLSSSQDNSQDVYATAFPFSSTFQSFNVKIDSNEKKSKKEIKESSINEDDDSSVPSIKKRKLSDLSEKQLADDRFTGTISNSNKSYNRWGLSTDEIKNAKEQSQQKTKNNISCWFCLSNPEVELHLVISVAKSFYIALAKGGLTDTNCLIIPIQHVPASIFLPIDALLEIHNYKLSLCSCFAKEDKEVIFVERYIPTKSDRQQHMIIQAFPVPKEKISNARNIIESEGQKIGIAFEHIEVPSYSSSSTPSSPLKNNNGYYIYFEIPNVSQKDENEQKNTINLYHTVKKPVNAQFARSCLALILGVSDVPWNASQSSKQAEIDAVNKFKAMFKQFDFSLKK